MDDHDGRSETIALMDYVSYSNDYQIHCHSSREEEDISTAEPVTGRPSLPSPGHNVLVWVILTVSFLSASLYLALPIGVHVCLQTECYLPQFVVNGASNDSSSDANITRTDMNGGMGQRPKASSENEVGGSCDVSVHLELRSNSICSTGSLLELYVLLMYKTCEYVLHAYFLLSSLLLS